jgi:hypothetical protein
MIEFKGTYYHHNSASKPVLVQYDGALLHIWQTADPFCKLLKSDVFHLQPEIGKGRRCIKLPNGYRIETNDVDAFRSLDASRRQAHGAGTSRLATLRRLAWLIGGSALLAGVFALLHHMMNWG